MSYDEIEPYYDYFDKICGVSGQAGNVRGKKIDGGNVFEGPRSDHYPNAPIKSSNAGLMYAAAAKSLGYHPFPAPVAIASAPYANAEGVPLGACEYCGFCNRIACETNAKASPNSTILPALRLDPKFEIRTRTLRHQAQLRQGRQKSGERDLHRHAQRRGIRTARRHRAADLLRVLERAAHAARRHRRAVRSRDRQGRRRQELRLSVRSRRQCVLREQGADARIGVRPAWGRDRRLQRRDLRSRRARLLRRRLYRPATPPPRRRSPAAPCRTARRNGARNGSAPP